MVTVTVVIEQERTTKDVIVIVITDTSAMKSIQVMLHLVYL